METVDAGAQASTPPSGTVTFLFTDIEGSTRLWQEFPAAMKDALARHHAVLQHAIDTHGGYVFQIVGDAFCAAFSTAHEGVAAALAAQRALCQESWGNTGPLRVRMALHTGMAEVHAGAYKSGEYASGLTLSRVARLLSVGHGGQILVSHTTEQLTRDQAPPHIELRDLGERRLRDLVRPERVFQVAAPGLPTDFPPLKSLDVLPNNLPIQLTSFIGREREMREVTRLLGENRLLTLTGPGGTGKTRLSLQVAAEVLDSFPDGVWLVELAPVSDPGLVPEAVASAVGVREEVGRSLLATLADQLRPRGLLLILDNCEHVVDASAQLAQGLLRACPRLKILASSREALDVAGEVSFRVPSLSLPDAREVPPVERLTDYEAIRLLADRATAVRRDFSVTTLNAAALVQICHRLDGIPLAIELAAARFKAMSAQQIAAHLDERFRLLTAGGRTALRRHQTLRGLIDWSYDLLSDAERALLRRLSVFASGLGLAAAEAVGAGEPVPEEDILDVLGRLVDKSLVMADEQEGETRYRLLETIRQYGGEKLREAMEESVVRERHRDFYLALAEEAEPRLQGSEQGAWLRRLEADHDNLRAALRWSLDGGDVESNLRFGASLGLFWDVHAHVNEGREWLDAILAKADEARGTPLTEASRRALAKTLDGAARLLQRHSELDRAKEMYRESIRLWRELQDKTGTAEALNSLGTLTQLGGDRHGAKALVEESLSLFRQVTDKRGIAHALVNLAEIVIADGDHPRARRLFEESVTLFRAIGDKRGLAHGLDNLGGILTREADFGRAEALYRESLQLSVELDDKHAIATVQRSLGDVARHQGDYAAAVAHYQPSANYFLQMSDKYCAGRTLTAFGCAAHDAGDLTRAKSLGEHALVLFRELALDADTALVLSLLGRVALAEGRAERATDFFRESLGLQRKLQDMAGVAATLEDLARVADSRRRPHRMVRLLGAAEALRAASGVSLAPLDRNAFERAAAAGRAELDQATFASAWSEGTALSLEQAIALATEEEAG